MHLHLFLERNCSMKHYINEFQSFDSFEKSILIAVAGLFLPFEIAAVVLGIVIAYGCIKGDLLKAIQKQTGAKWLYAFALLQIVVTLFYQNWIGLMNAAGYVGIALFIAYYRDRLNPKLFQYIVSEIIILSLFAAAWGLYEFKIVSENSGYSFFDFKIQEKPEDRIHAMFMNANFYATICEFVIVFCLYKFIRTNKISMRISYLAIAFINFIMMLLTGCRTALLPFVFIFLVFFWQCKEKGWLMFSAVSEGAALLIVSQFPTLIPRITNMKTFASRVKIWTTAKEAIMMHPMFGQGPQTYGFVYKSLNGHKAPHAHNIYIDSILSFGIVGTCIGLMYFGSLWKEIREYKMWKEDIYIFPLILSFIIIALVHGILDCTLNFVATGIIFMMVLNSCSQFIKNI